MKTKEQELKDDLKAVIWLFETMMEAVDVDLDDTEIRWRHKETDEQLGEMKSLNQILDIFREKVK